ncbi:hypothetical protein [Amycolatopsis sp. NPDC004079]|uniref:RimK family alpha-L-glutamate ligase n=1 Tax=Amycolatopsis halotolerans TaxID=330083 RepID=A0ABV7QF45_9PSEU
MTAKIDIAILDRGIPYLEMQGLLDTLRGRGLEAAYLNYDDVVFSAGGSPLRHRGEQVDPAVVLIRSRFFSRISEAVSVFDSLAMLENAGIRVVNAASGVQQAHNKVLSVDVLARAGLPVPRTRLVRTLEHASECLREWGDVVFKPVHGIASTDNVLLRDQVDFRSPDTPHELSLGNEIKLSYLLRTHESMCAQEFVPNTGSDVRAMCIEDQVVACYQRKTLHSPADEKTRENPQLVEPYECTAELVDTVVAATRCFGLEHSCVDFAEGLDGSLTILEVNPTISFWRHVADDSLHRTPDGVGSAFADMLVHALESSDRLAKVES